MKPKIITLLAFLAIVSMASAQNLYRTLSAKKANSPVTVDGFISASEPWQAADWVNVDNGKTANSTSGMTATFQLLWDDTNLYFAGKVNDNTRNIGNATTYTNDCIEFFLDVDTTVGDTKYKTGTFQIRKQAGPDGLIDGTVGGVVTTDATMIASTDDGSAYIQEWALPWEVLTAGMDDPMIWKTNMCVHFDLDVSDATTDGARTQQQFWNDNSDLQWNNTSKFGLVKLSSTSVAGSGIIFPKINGNNTLVFGSSPVLLGAYHNKGLAIKYTSSNTAIANVLSGYLYVYAAGQVTITASTTATNLYPASSFAQNITIDKMKQTISFASLPTLKVGDADYTPTVSASSELVVTLTSSNTSVATIVNGKIRVIGEGYTTITASQAGNSDIYAATMVNRSLSVVKKAQTISFEPLPIKRLGDADFGPSITINSGLPLTIGSSNPAVATIVDGKIKIVGEGATTISASQEGNSEYYAANVAQQVLYVTSKLKTDQTITFATLPNKLVTDDPFTITAVASSGLPVVLTSSNPSVATISGNSVTITGAGMSIIYAVQQGDNSFNPAQIVLQSLNVSKLKQTLKFAAIPNQNTNVSEYTLSAEASSGLPVLYTSSDPTIASINNNKVVIIKPGIVTISALQEGNAIYDTVSIAQQMVIEKASAVYNTRMSKVSVYPSPASSWIQISLTDAIGNTEYSIYSLEGKLVGSGILNLKNSSVSVSNLRKGLYTIKILNNNVISYSKFVKR